MNEVNMLFARNATNFSRSAARPLIAHSMFSSMQVSNLGFSSQDTLFYIAASEAVGLFKV